MKQAVVDTSVIIGYLERADLTLKKSAEAYEELIILAEVIIETAYVLENVYRRERGEIVMWVTNLLNQPKLKYDRKILFNTLFRYRDNQSLSIVDCYVLETAESEECPLITLDKRMAKTLVV